MSRLFILSCCAFAVAQSGCGPMQAPLPARLDDESQKSVNDSWEKALSPVNRFDNQSLLDILLATGAYQLGVDKLEFRSEKSFSGGVVVMEVRFERSSPERDQFTVSVQDRQGKVLRQERYDRAKIETTYGELFVQVEQLRQKRAQGLASAEEVRKLEGYEARLKTVESVFPKIPTDKGAQVNQQQKPKQ